MDTKIAAIALVLVVAVPIMLGYALALEEEEITGYQTSSRTNLTDSMLNAVEPIYVESTAPSNNANLYARIYYPGSGVTETGLHPPAYSSISGNYSALPTYTSSSGTMALTASTTYTTAGSDEGSYSKFYTDDWGTYPYIHITTDQLAQINIPGGQSYLGMDFGPFVDTGGAWYGSFDSYGHEGYTTSIEIVSDRYPTYTVTHRPYTIISDDLGDRYSFTIPATSAVKLTHNDGSSDTFIVPPSSGDTVVSRSGKLAVVNGVSYNNIDEIYVAPSPSLSVLYYTKLTASSYADPSYGWTTAISPGDVVYPYWMNGNVNESIRMMMAIEDSEFVDMNTVDQNGYSSSVVQIRKTSGNVTVDGTSLGKYTYLCLDISGDSVTVSGINSWPNMFAQPNIINSVTVDLATQLEDFTLLYLNGSDTIEYRVDSAMILSGYFGTIENYTLDMSQLWPGDSYSITLKSSGIYGSSISFAGNTYNVTDGTITVNGSQIRLLDAIFSSIYDDDSSTWSNQINGVELSTSANPSTIVFGGEWSITVFGYKVEEVTSTELRWQAGEFAFVGADSNFALMGLLTCVGLFIALAMYGRRSGAKVGTLMIICGCAAFVFLALM